MPPRSRCSGSPASTARSAPGSTERSLEVVADARGSAALDQSIVQVGGVEGAGTLEQWAGQQAELGQGVGAAAEGRQDARGRHDGQRRRPGRRGGRGRSRPDGRPGRARRRRAAHASGRGSSRRSCSWRTRSRRPSRSFARRAAGRRAAGLSRRISPSAGRRRCRRRRATTAPARRPRRSRRRSASSPRRSPVTSQTVSSTGGVASSDAAAANRSLVLQAGAQSMNGAAALDLQELVQETVVLQTALASSRSDGGIGGIARTTNCSTVQQGAGQGIGAPVSMGAVDLTAFCAPPAEAPASALGRGRRGSAPRRPDAACHRDRSRPAVTACGSRRGACAGARLPERIRRPAEPRAARSLELRAGTRPQRLPAARRAPHTVSPPSLRKRASTRARRASRGGRPSTGSRRSLRRMTHRRGSRRSHRAWRRPVARGSQRSSSPSRSRHRSCVAGATERSSGDRAPCSLRSTSRSDVASPPWTCRPGPAGDFIRM